MDNVVYDLLVPTLSFGAIGAMTGSVLAVSRARPVPGYLVTTGLNFALLGGSFTVLRRVGRTVVSGRESDRVWIGAVSGAVTGGVFSAAMRGSRGMVGAVLLYGGMGGLGEAGVVAIQARFSPDTTTTTTKRPGVDEHVRESDKSVWRRLKESSPLRPIPDEEFETMMSNKIADLDEQIRLVDEELAATRAQLSQARPQQ